MLCEKIRWILRPQDLEKLKFLPAKPLLYPQAVTLQVSQFAQALATGRAHGRLAVRPNPQRQPNATIPQESLQPKADTSGPDQAIEFRLPAAEREAGLRG